ncbi:MAG: S8 family serine peptidase [Saprospiraceae bacterium]|nr:S8 family serine peptidase [Saprospiraceae bacterium]
MRYLLTLMLAAAVALLHAQTNPTNIDDDLWQKAVTESDARHAAFILLKDRVDAGALLLEMEQSGLPIDVRSRLVVTRLLDKADATQPALLQRMRRMDGLDHEATRSFWAVNGIIVSADKTALQRIAAFPEVEFIYGDEPVQIDPPTGQTESFSSPNGNEPGHRAIKAPFMWNLGYTGYGQKIFVIDTGQDPDHPAMDENYWGQYAPKSVAWHAGGFPEDCAEHGTHVTGTTCGIDRKTNDTIGVAFNAHWMGGPINFSTGTLGCTVPFDQTTFDAIEHLQWALNPDGNAATTDDIPDVVNCSFGVSANLCSQSIYTNLFNALEAAGIPVIWAAGNSGPGASTVDGEASISISEVNSFSVGAIDGANVNFPIAGFSSRGPSLCSGTGSIRIKPEVVAPGVSVRSAQPGGGYQNLDGTSMAAPHVAGAIALLREAFPNASGILLKQSLYNTAIDLGTTGEDNTYGRGIIDLSAAYQYLINNGQTPATPVSAERDAIALGLTVSGVCNGPNTLTAEVENSGTTPLTAISLRYGIEGVLVNTYTWNGQLAPNQFTSIALPELQGIAAGTYEFFFEIIETNGQADPRFLNNRFKRTFEKYNEEYVTGSVSALQPLPVCNGARVLLSIDEAQSGSRVAEWYTSPSAQNPVATGNTYLTPALSANTTYYLNTAQVAKVGRVESNGVNSNSGNGLRFTATRPFTLRSVKVNAPDAGVRIIRLEDKDGVLVTQRTVIVQAGEQRIELNFNVPEGKDHRLLLSTSGKALIVTQTGTTYPYTVPGIVSITGSIGFGSFYYYFFDWEIAAPSYCGRAAVPVTVNSGQTATAVTISGPDTLYLSQGNTVQFADATPGASNQSWDFGNATTGTGANPTATYSVPGVYTVTLTNRNAAGCNNAGQKVLRVLQSVSAPEPLLKEEQVMLFPNPTGDVLYIGFTDVPAMPVDLSIFDLYGRRVQFLPGLQAGAGVSETQVGNLPAGMYVVHIGQGGNLLWTGKFAKN